METIILGQGTAGGVHFYDAASAEDDLGGGRIYAALVKQAILKRFGQADASVVSLVEGGAPAESLTLGADGAVIADTTDKSNIPMQIVCPVGFAASLQDEIQNESGTTMELCSIGVFFNSLIAVCNRYSVPAWDTFATWFDGYRTYLNDSTPSANMAIETLDGQKYNGVCKQMEQVAKISDIFSWLKSCLPPSMLASPAGQMIANNNSEKIGLIVTMTNLGGTYESFLGLTTAVMQFYIRL